MQTSTIFDVALFQRVLRLNAGATDKNGGFVSDKRFVDF